MESPNSGGWGTDSQLAISCRQMKFPVGTGSHPILLLPKESHGNPPTTQAAANIIGCSPDADSSTPLLKKTLTQLIEHGRVELVPT